MARPIRPTPRRRRSPSTSSTSKLADPKLIGAVAGAAALGIIGAGLLLDDGTPADGRTSTVNCVIYGEQSHLVRRVVIPAYDDLCTHGNLTIPGEAMMAVDASRMIEDTAEDVQAGLVAYQGLVTATAGAPTVSGGIALVTKDGLVERVIKGDPVLDAAAGDIVIDAQARPDVTLEPGDRVTVDPQGNVIGFIKAKVADPPGEKSGVGP